MKESYWNNFYKNKEVGGILSPSSFAVYTKNFISTNPKNAIEFGCGNGRDSFFLEQVCQNYTAIDSSKITIDQLSESSETKINFVQKSVSNINDFENNYDLIYSRFFLHSIDKKLEEIFLKWCSDANTGTLFFLECRSEKDYDLYKVFGKDHYRRKVSFNSLKNKLIKNGFKILESIESRGLAAYKAEDPWIIRIAAIKELGELHQWTT